MGFCYPGKGKSGDLPPRPECSATWMHLVLSYLSNVKLTLVIGFYAHNYFLKTSDPLTTNIHNWKKFSPKIFPLPHPSPRNNIWLKKNPWFEKNLIPELQKAVKHALKSK
jgi:uracil-DNA glycosylase